MHSKVHKLKETLTKDSVFSLVKGGKTDKGLGEIWGISQSAAGCVRRFFGVPSYFQHRYRIPLRGVLRSVFIGSMLGDGGLCNKNGRVSFIENHCWAQRGYLQWKHGVWGDFVGLYPVCGGDSA